MSRKYYSSYYSHTPFTFTVIFFIFIGIVLLGSLYRSISVGTGALQYKTVTVTDKTVKRGINAKTDLYLIYTKDQNGNVHVFEISDSILAGRFNSSDIYGGIEIGQKYKFGYRGTREPLFSWYPNIYTYELIDDEVIT